jgi:GT2 family glycosyltransferase
MSDIYLRRMKLSCILTTRNRCDRIVRTLDHLEHTVRIASHDWEILVVDNGSTDGTADAVSQRRHVKLISLAENEGVPARNLALVHARGRYIAFVGDDVCPAANALPMAMTYLSRHPKTAAVVGRIVHPDESAEAPALPAALMGDACVVRKAVLDSIGGFAAEFFRQAADDELSFRIWSAGSRIERFEDLIFSRQSPPIIAPSDLARRMALRNNLILCERYLPRHLRRTYRADWLRRYTLLARHSINDAAANAAVKQSRVWARREAQVGRRTMSAQAIESIFGLDFQRQTIARWAKTHGIHRVCIGDWGKNLFATWQACRDAGLKIQAVLEHDAAFSGAAYRTIPVHTDSAVKPDICDGIVLSTLNPAKVAHRAAELELSFKKPILRLWEPRLLQPGIMAAKADRAA